MTRNNRDGKDILIIPISDPRIGSDAADPISKEFSNYVGK